MGGDYWKREWFKPILGLVVAVCIVGWVIEGAFYEIRGEIFTTSYKCEQEQEAFYWDNPYEEGGPSCLFHFHLGDFPEHPVGTPFRALGICAIILWGLKVLIMLMRSVMEKCFTNVDEPDIDNNNSK